MKVNRYKQCVNEVMVADNSGDWVKYSDFLKLNNMFENDIHEYRYLLEDMLDYYKVGGYSRKGKHPTPTELAHMLGNAIESYIVSELEGLENSENSEELLEEVKHLRDYTDHLVQFSKLPCLPKDLENLRVANGQLAEENHRLKNEISGWENKWDCAIQMAAESENKLECIRQYLTN
jgi:hypothetical protein